MVLPAIIAGGAALAGGLLASKAQGDATDAAQAGLAAQIKFDREVWNDQLKLFKDGLDLQKSEFRDLKKAVEPWRVSGENALSAYNYEMFGGDKPMLTNYDALQDRREILSGDKQLGRLRDSNVFAAGDGFGYGRGPSYGRIEKDSRTVTTPATAAGGGAPGGPGYYTDADGNYVYSASGGAGMTPAGGTPATTSRENVFTVGDREFDSRGDARDFIDRRFARGYDGETFDTRKEARQALGGVTREARRDALADAGFERGSVREEYGGYSKSPEARLRIREGSRAIEGSAAAQGGLLSGDTINALAKDRDAVVTADKSNYMNRLLGLSDTGLSTIGTTGSSDPLAGARLGTSIMGNQNIGGTMANIGSINAQGAAAQGNIFQNVLGQLGGIGGYFGGSGASSGSFGNTGFSNYSGGLY
tara:strand:- start:20467 stop:21720 length:1254 start_codon:yes stop_codon:yes gene_type:complete